MLGHQAPILSAQIDPLDSFVVSYLHYEKNLTFFFIYRKRKTFAND